MLKFNAQEANFFFVVGGGVGGVGGTCSLDVAQPLQIPCDLFKRISGRRHWNRRRTVCGNGGGGGVGTVVVEAVWWNTKIYLLICEKKE